MYKRILVPTDLSKLSGKAVREALKLAKLAGAEVIALHVYPKFSGIPYGTFGAAQDVLEAAHDEHAREAAQRLSAIIAKDAASTGVAYEVTLSKSNEVWKTIIATAKKRKCDLICMASHGRRGLSGLLLGSETTKVLTHSELPVLVLR
jgi:nucleotide-binding universal stress UspA family protein